MTSSNDRRAQPAQSQSQSQSKSQHQASSPSLSNGTTSSTLAHELQPPSSRAPMSFGNGSAAHTRDESWSLPPPSLRSANGLSMGPVNDVADFGSEHISGNSSMAPIGTPSAIKRPPTPRWKVMITGLPAGMTEDALSSMLVWAAQDILSFKLDRGAASDNLITASIFLSSAESARLIHQNLNGHQNIAKTSVMNVNILPPPGSFSTSAASTSREVSPVSSGAATASSASTYGGTPNTRSLPQSRFNIDSALNGLSRVHNESKGSEADFDGFYRARVHQEGGSNAHTAHGTNGSASFASKFGSQSPIDPLPWDMRVSGKSFIENNSNDDETSALIRDPIAYAESGPNVPRSRPQTQIPIDDMNNLSLNTNVPPHTLPPSSSSLTSPHGYPLSPTGNGHVPYVNGTNGYRPEPHMWNNPPFPSRQVLPPSNPADQNAPCNTLYVGNLPLQTNEEELKAVFSKQRGYKRLCFRTKNNGPMCFVEFEDTSFATKALKELYGYPLHNSTKGGIRLSFSKNPLGVRSQHHGNQTSMGGMGGMHAAANGGANGLASVSGPPPGLSAPPGLGHINQHATALNGNHPFNHQPGYGPGINSPWNGNGRGNLSAGGQTTPGGLNGSHTPNGFGFNGGGIPRSGYGNSPASGQMNGSNTPNGFHHGQGGAGGMPPHMMGR